MSGMFLIPIMGMAFIFGLIWLVFHYVTKWRTSKPLTPQDERLLADLWDVSRKLEGRLKTLESILDHDVPGWRRSVQADEPASDESGTRPGGRA